MPVKFFFDVVMYMYAKENFVMCSSVFKKEDNCQIPLKKSRCSLSSILVEEITERTFVETLTVRDVCIFVKKNERNQSKRADGYAQQNQVRKR